MSNPAAEEKKELGNKAFGSKNFPEAISQYSEAIKLDPSNHVYFSNRSASYGGKGEWEEAAKDAKECIRLNPSFIKGYYRLCTAQTELRDWDAAIATIKQGLQVDPENSQLTKQLRQVKAKRASAKRASEKSEKSEKAISSINNANFTSTTDREVLDLQNQFINTNREYQQVKASIHKSQREQKMNQLTQSELSKIPSEDTNAKMYRGIGKMFMLSSRGDIMDYLEKGVEEELKKEESLNSKAEYLERKMKSQQTNIMELTKARE